MHILNHREMQKKPGFFLEIRREIYYYYNLQCNVLNCNYNEQERREPCENEM